MRLLHRVPFRKTFRGQALIETALVMTLIIIIVASVVEFGFMLNAYLSLQDAARNASRFSSDSLYYFRDDIHRCVAVGGQPATEDFYRQTACLVNMELDQARPLITLSLSITDQDDVVISAFAIAGAGMAPTPTVLARYPEDLGEAGWSESLDWYGYRNRSSRITRTQIESHLDTLAPSTGFVAVEIYSHYDHLMKLPWITAFIPDPFPMYTYAIMPLVSAEPDD
jgi:Flp pilus assembly protein TadG